VKDEAAVTADLVQGVLCKQGGDLIILEPTFKVDLAIVEELTSEGSGSRMMLILRCLPDDNRITTVDESLVASQKLSASDAGRTADRGSQRRMKFMLKLVGNIKAAIPLQAESEAEEGSFFATMFGVLPFLRAGSHCSWSAGGP
jgi:hypothetical protein